VSQGPLKVYKSIQNQGQVALQYQMCFWDLMLDNQKLLT
jgi:hypothetical protein